MKGYVTLGTNNLEAAVEFYEQLLAGLGISRGVEFPGRAVRFGTESGTELVVITPADGKPATAGNGTMVALKADSQEQIQELHAKALELGGTDEGAPGYRTETFYGAYFRDLDGNKLVLYTE